MKFWFERGAWASSQARQKISLIKPNQVKKIAVVRHAALGDMLLLRPFLGELRKFFPNAKITLSLVSNYLYGAPSDLVDELHVMHGNEKKSSLRDKYAVIKSLRSVDILFDLADTHRSRYLCLLSDARLKIGFPYRWYLRHMLLDAAVPRSDFAFEADNMLDTLRLLGAKPADPLNYCWPPEPASSVLEGPFIVYFPFASIENKCWPQERYQELIRQLADRYPEYEHVVLGGISEFESVNTYRFLERSIKNVRLQESLPLNETLSLLREASLVISNDTGIRNAAIAVSTPTIGVFYSTVPYRYWPKNQAHDIVFNSDGSIPDVSSVLSAVEKALAKWRCPTNV